MRVVRLCTRKHPPLDGVGASRTGGRWNSPGKQVVYTASCSALAILEYVVHAHGIPTGLIICLIEIPDTLTTERTGGWAPADIPASRQIGDEWINHQNSAVLEVPSVLLPRQKNYLLNPLHPLFGAIKIIEENPFALDSRLSRLLSSIPPPSTP
jgi:RES domain-containing protein